MIHICVCLNMSHKTLFVCGENDDWHSFVFVSHKVVHHPEIARYTVPTIHHGIQLVIKCYKPA